MKKGVSLVSLGIVLIILSIIMGAVVVNSNEYLKNFEKSRFVSDYMLVESAVEKYYGNNQFYPIKKVNGVDETILLVADEEADELQFGNNIIEAREGIELKVIDVSLLGFDSLTTGSGKIETDYYGLSDDGDIYYLKGFKYDEKIYYKVTDDLK